MILIDVNILVYTHREDSEHHKATREWLERALCSQNPVGVSDLVLSGFLRVVTHPKIFIDPTPLALALKFAAQFREHPNVFTVEPGKRHWGIFRSLCLAVRAKGNTIPDAFHAALAIETGCEWVSTDSGFSRFPGLIWKHPLDGPDS
jgi:uncharacterized protein